MKLPTPSLPLVLLGAGGHAKVLLSTALELGRTVYGVCDPELSRSRDSVWRGIRVLGDDSEIDVLDPVAVELVNGLGQLVSATRRQVLHQSMKRKGFIFATLVHPRAWVDASTRLCEGVQVMAGAVIQADCEIGDGSIVNTRASIDHDCRVGARVHIAPGATICGTVHIGDDTFVGSGAIIGPGVKIGTGAIIGAGSVVLRDVAMNERYLGCGNGSGRTQV